MSKVIDSDSSKEQLSEKGKGRRDFIVDSAIGITCVGAVAAAVPIVSSLGPSADVLAVGSTEVDLSKIKEGATATVMWRGNPVFIKHRSKSEIEAAENVNLEDLKDPQADEERVKKGNEQWLVSLAVCTHLGCVPQTDKGDFPGGWLCPCHGSHYDTSARIRKGPAPINLPIPPYEFISDTKIKIG